MMWTDDKSLDRSRTDCLYVSDLLPSMVTCIAVDPGDDQSSDPDEFPEPDDGRKDEQGDGEPREGD